MRCMSFQTFKNKILCWIGFHRWEFWKRQKTKHISYHNKGWYGERVLEKCQYCGAIRETRVFPVIGRIFGDEWQDV